MDKGPSLGWNTAIFARFAAKDKGGAGLIFHRLWQTKAAPAVVRGRLFKKVRSGGA